MSKQIPLQRIKWIDLTKGVAIFLMVCGHTGIPLLIYVESLTLSCAFLCFKLLIIMILLLIKAFG